ncbi:MAG TPA: hypothetical protein DCE42_04170 [Myxococcales bacterium]|nr:hypothetical protein [Deltaproteobacteria bacterium]HAA53922.1 hypothetical protein [Myxococcales bacterium]|tara:strand:- start:40007 stop:40492 length:486 start_codon:yes stop_codon:yes gene_type:complete
MSEYELIAVPGVCAGHPEHPELLWLFHLLPSGKLRFVRLEIDFPEPAEPSDLFLRKFDVDMTGFSCCPYCEAELYFFCKRCRTLSCFSWNQVPENQKWKCNACNSVYRMKPKRTPFQVEAQVNTTPQTSLPSSGETSASISRPNTGNINPNQTQQWHPKIK